jgi:hypothetical protein
MTFNAFPGEWRTDLAGSMERCNLSQCRRETIDKVLDPALAFEIATSGGDNASVGGKVSIRTAQLIGGALETRQGNRRAINELCKIRNRATHGTRLKSIDRMKHDDIWLHAAHLYKELLTKFVELRPNLDWDAIELGPAFKTEMPPYQLQLGLTWIAVLATITPSMRPRMISR